MEGLHLKSCANIDVLVRYEQHKVLSQIAVRWSSGKKTVSRKGEESASSSDED